MNKKGFIYVLLNPSFINILKIGKTQRTSEERAKELYRQAKTGIPTEFVVAYENEVSDCELVESLVHKELAKQRINSEKEFFKIPLKEAIKTIEKIIGELEKQQKIYFLEKQKEEFSPQKWWDNLSFVWQQVFRNHILINYPLPSDIDLVRAIHNIIDHCQEDKLRQKVSNLITDKIYIKKLSKWYNTLGIEKELFNSYLPFELKENQIKEVLSLTKVNCSNNMAVIDLKPLEYIHNLKQLNCLNTYVSDLYPLKNLSMLEEINLNYTKVDSLKPIVILNNLKKIYCYGTSISMEEIERIRKDKTTCEIVADSFLAFVKHEKRD